MNEENFILWQTIFPAWPRELFSKFEQQIYADFPKYGLPDVIGWVPWWAGTISPPAQATYRYDWPAFQPETNFSFNLANPQNSRYAVTARWDVNFWMGTEYSIFGGNAPQSMHSNNNMNMAPDGISSVNLHVFMNYDNRLYQNNFAWSYATIANLYGYEDRSNGFFSYRVGKYNNFLVVAPNASAMPYDGAETIIAMYENSMINGGMDYAALYDYLDYRNAFQKYASQIESTKNLLTIRSESELNQYKQDFSDRLSRERADLDVKKLQIFQAIQNDQQSAKRDYMSQLIAAQNLKISLQGALNG